MVEPRGRGRRGRDGGRGGYQGRGGRGGRGGRDIHSGRGRGRWAAPGMLRGHARPKAKVPKQQQPYAEERGGAYRPSGAALTIQEIEEDKLTKIAKANWQGEGAKGKAFDPELVKRIYDADLHGSAKTAPPLRPIMLLEVSQYLDRYLWPNYKEGKASPQHVMSIAAMVVERARENVPAWACFADKPEAFGAFFQQFLDLKAHRVLNAHERLTYLLFCIHALQSLETPVVWAQVRRLVSLPLWHALSPGRLQLELHANEDVLGKPWKQLAKREAKAAAAAEAAGKAHVPIAQRSETTFIPSLLTEFLQVLQEAVPEDAGKGVSVSPSVLLYCERFVEFLVDLLSQAPTRRFVRTVLEDRAVLVKCRLAPLNSHAQGRLFGQLVDMLRFYMAFPIADLRLEPLSDEDVQAAHAQRVQAFQRLLFKHHPPLRELALANVGSVASRTTLAAALAEIDTERLTAIVTQQLRLVDPEDPWGTRREFLEEVLLATFEQRQLQTQAVTAMPLYPTEAILWDDNQVPDMHYTGETCLALPKLNLQFLTITDYLLRNFHLFRLEATYEIREDIADILPRFQVTLDDEDRIQFAGWARMALPLVDFSIIEVKHPNVGEVKPAGVTADVVFTCEGLRGDVHGEWDEVKQHDVLFLLTIRPPDAAALASFAASGATPRPDLLHGLTYVRGCEVMEVKDEEGSLMNDFTGRIKRDEWQPPAGLRRTVTVAMDTAQYQLDMAAVQDRQAEDVYSTFNLLMRRKPKENNFKAVLESIRDLMTEHHAAMPDWLLDIFLGYGDPAAASYQNLPNALSSIDFKDTFLDEGHLRASFPEHDVEVASSSGTSAPEPPFKVTFLPASVPEANGSAKPSKRKRAADGAAQQADGQQAQRRKLHVQPYTPPDPGPYPQNRPPQNKVRFTPVQVEAIKSGVNPGLTMVVGPPGTGKTDTAVQIMHVLYHNFPDQRTLLIAHSNQALNDLFEKLLQRDVPARYLLRLGQGEQELATRLDFSRVGRVNAMLARRLQLLAEVERMAKQLGVAGDVAYTCETAAHFWLLHVLARWEQFVAAAEASRSDDCIQSLFPFKAYFEDAPGGLFRKEGYVADMERARGAFRHLKTMFQELEECRAFELLKGQGDRVNYLMTKQAKVVAMTCTHAALRRGEFLRLGFQYDNLLMEESAQILEIETFIPMLLQKAQDGRSRLKRVTLIGDHHQLPPVVKNMAFQRYSHLDQSLFTRFVRLGSPFIQLNAQGRARPSLAALYNWRYEKLGDLPNVTRNPEYRTGNAGMAFDYQLIDVPDGEESAPMPYFYQNLAEARHLVSLYQYLRLRGHPADKISVLTTYNGQKALLREEIEHRCAGSDFARAMFGRPLKVTTVDKYQGQQNDIVLLSLVRTRAVGHVRDVRRLVVAMSRARLGLYVFAKAQLFADCYELAPSMKLLTARPQAPALLPKEYHGECSRAEDQRGQYTLSQHPGQLAGLVDHMAMERHLAMHNSAAFAQAQQAAAPGEASAPPGAEGDQEMQQVDQRNGSNKQQAGPHQPPAQQQGQQQPQAGTGQQQPAATEQPESAGQLNGVAAAAGDVEMGAEGGAEADGGAARQS